jgi:hypothetical protein
MRNFGLIGDEAFPIGLLPLPAQDVGPGGDPRVGVLRVGDVSGFGALEEPDVLLAGAGRGEERRSRLPTGLRAPHHLRVVVLAQARRPRGCLDRVADTSGYFQAVAAPGAVAFGSAVGAHEQTDPVAPQPLGDVVEDKMLPRVAGVRTELSLGPGG